MKRSELEIKYLKNRTIENRIRYEKWRNFYSKLYKKERKNLYPNTELRNLISKRV